ncbi:MauE/DoxX family redox-associated membrane protein [Planctomycetota bacterium]
MMLRWLIVGGLWILIAATYPLWTATGDFPQIPFFGFLTATPQWVDHILIGMLAVFTFAFAFGRASVRWNLNWGLGAAGVLSLLTFLDQHRFQPWVYLTVVQFVILSVPDSHSKREWKLIRFLLASIYIYSAISKFDHSFFQHLGLRFVDTFLNQIGTNPHLMVPAKKLWMIWLFPIGEMLVGIGLIVPVTRRFAVGASMLLHAVLIMILGPWGLDHHLGVLLWNVLFASEVLVAFGRVTPIDDEAEKIPTVGRPFMQSLAVLATVVCIGLPLWEIAGGKLDHWPAWSLYSDRTDKVELFIDSEHAAQLPPDVLRHLGPPIPFQTWRKLYLEQWSLSETRAPIYPEDRFQVGVIADVCNQLGLANKNGGAKMVVHGPPDRMSGKRQNTSYIGTDAINGAAIQFRLNSKARSR